MTTLSRLRTNLRQVYQMIPKWPRAQRQRYTIYVLLVNAKFQSVSLYDLPFWSYRPVWRQVYRRPQNDILTLQGKRYILTLQGKRYTIPLVSPSHKFESFHSMTSCFWATGHVEKTAPNDPKITLNATRPNIPHICVTRIPDSQISLCFAL